MTHFWEDKETEFMLTQLKDLIILKYVDERKMCEETRQMVTVQYKQTDLSQWRTDNFHR